MTDWRPVEGFPGYSVSDEGQVVGPSGRPLRQYATPDAGLRVTLRCRAGPRHRWLHRLVAQAFLGAGRDDQVRPSDGNIRNVRADNLKVVLLTVKRRTLAQRLHQQRWGQFSLTRRRWPKGGEGLTCLAVPGYAADDLDLAFRGKQDGALGWRAHRFRVPGIGEYTPADPTSRDLECIRCHAKRPAVPLGQER